LTDAILSSPSCTAHNLQTVEDELQPGTPGFLIYSASKVLADCAARDFKQAHPDLDLTTIRSAYVYAPQGTDHVYHSPATGTSWYIYELITGAPDRPVPGYYPLIRSPPLHVDVRDVARAQYSLSRFPPPTCRSGSSSARARSPGRRR
jgi:nucleoside-diphosphate-sugar epimerase